MTLPVGLSSNGGNVRAKEYFCLKKWFRKHQPNHEIIFSAAKSRKCPLGIIRRLWGFLLRTGGKIIIFSWIRTLSISQPTCVGPASIDAVFCNADAWLRIDDIAAASWAGVLMKRRVSPDNDDDDDDDCGFFYRCFPKIQTSPYDTELLR